MLRELDFWVKLQILSMSNQILVTFIINLLEKQFPMFDDNIGVIVHHTFYFFQIIRLDVARLHQDKLFSVPFQLRITIVTDDVNMDRQTFKTEKHKHVSVCSKFLSMAFLSSQTVAV